MSLGPIAHASLLLLIAGSPPQKAKVCPAPPACPAQTCEEDSLRAEVLRLQSSLAAMVRDMLIIDSIRSGAYGEGKLFLVMQYTKDKPWILGAMVGPSFLEMSREMRIEVARHLWELWAEKNLAMKPNREESMVLIFSQTKRPLAMSNKSGSDILLLTDD